MMIRFIDLTNPLAKTNKHASSACNLAKSKNNKKQESAITKNRKAMLWLAG